MADEPKRTVKAAIIDGIGPVTAIELLSMHEERWVTLRNRITDNRKGFDNTSAHCMMCGSPVFITKRMNRPLFKHYKGNDPKCPWFTGENTHPDDARAAQYQGQQASVLHEKMCLLIGELASLDSRYIGHTIEEYLPPTENEHGRYPDVYVNWDWEHGPFAIEFQFSSTFQTEISERCKHYEREGIPLLWVLFGVDTAKTLKQSFIDVINRHRGNAFVLDAPAIEASRANKTLILTCFKRSGGEFEPPELVRFDELQFPKSRLPYYEDMIAAPLLEQAKLFRLPYFQALKKWRRHQPLIMNPDVPEFQFDRFESDLIAAAFSIIAKANSSEFVIEEDGEKYHTYLKTRQNLTATLNTLLHCSNGSIPHYAHLLKKLISATSIRAVLLRSSVGDHLERAINNVSQVEELSEEWWLLKRLFAEALDPQIKSELQYYGQLPKWVASPES